MKDSCFEALIERYHPKDMAFRMIPTLLSTSFEHHLFEGKATKEQMLALQQRVGSLMYPAVSTRTDLALATSKLSQHSRNLSRNHLSINSYKSWYRQVCSK